MLPTHWVRDAALAKPTSDGSVQEDNELLILVKTTRYYLGSYAKFSRMQSIQKHEQFHLDVHMASPRFLAKGTTDFKLLNFPDSKLKGKSYKIVRHPNLHDA